MKWVPFLLIAVVAMAVCLGGVGGWLLPQLGVEGPVARAIGGGLGGVIVAILYMRMIKGPGGA
ncbi:MAG: hypothetical protein AB7O91_10295 [Sphingomonas sp.]